MRKTLCFLIGLYQRFVSPMLPPHCRYTPSCSEYAVQAIQQHGALYGTWLGVKRLARCNPFGSHGYDPVPDNTDEMNHAEGAGARNSKHNNP